MTVSQLTFSCNSNLSIFFNSNHLAGDFNERDFNALVAEHCKYVQYKTTTFSCVIVTTHIIGLETGYKIVTQ